MDFFLLRNKKTGWIGGVTEKIYRDKIRYDEYEDPRTADGNAPEITAKPDHISPLWELVPKSPGWFDVSNGNEIANEKALRKDAAETLRDRLNG